MSIINRDKQATNAGSGPEFFGFSHPTIMSLIQNMTGADKCTKYKRTNFLMATSRSKQSSKGSKTGTGGSSKKAKTSSKPFYRSTRESLGDASLAPLVINQQLPCRDFMSSSEGEDTTSHSEHSTGGLVIDTLMS